MLTETESPTPSKVRIVNLLGSHKVGLFCTLFLFQKPAVQANTSVAMKETDSSKPPTDIGDQSNLKQPTNPQPYSAYKVSSPTSSPAKQPTSPLMLQVSDEVPTIAVRKNLFPAEDESEPTKFLEEDKLGPLSSVTSRSEAPPLSPASLPDSGHDTLSPLRSEELQAKSNAASSPAGKRSRPTSKAEEEIVVEINKAGGVLGIQIAGGSDTALQVIMVSKETISTLLVVADSLGNLLLEAVGSRLVKFGKPATSSCFSCHTSFA